MQLFNFSTELVEKVKNNWLVKDNANEFVNCKTSDQWCLTFFSVANKTGFETSIANEISEIVIKETLRRQNESK